jgi:hypothetical protein
MNVEDERLAVTTTSQPPNASCVAFLTWLVLPVVAWADYTTAETLSLEWVVHSSDAIYLVRTVEPQQDRNMWSVAVVKTLREPTTSPELIAKSLEATKRRSVKAGDEWLVFVRTSPDKPPALFYWVNLTRPLESPWTAAINAKGTPLTRKWRFLKPSKTDYD